MNETRIGAGRAEGASLLEVLIALSLLATSVLGAAAAQLSALRDLAEQARREQGVWTAASMAEAMRLPDASATVLAREHERAASTLPGVRVSVVDEARGIPGIGAVVLKWPPGRGAFGQPSPERVASGPLSNDDLLGSGAVLPFARRP